MQTGWFVGAEKREGENTGDGGGVFLLVITTFVASSRVSFSPAYRKRRLKFRVSRDLFKGIVLRKEGEARDHLQRNDGKSIFGNEKNFWNLIEVD